MSDGKKDITRIEDLSEYLHELDETSEEENFESFEVPETLDEEDQKLDQDDEISFSDDFSSELPSVPSNDEEEKEEESDFSLPSWDVEETETTHEFESEPFELTTEEPLPQVDNHHPRPVSENNYKAPETFNDLKTFSESSSFSSTTTDANPSFSVLLRDIRYLEDVNDILSLLKEFNLLNNNEEQTKERLMRGSFLVPRISEYLAIYLAHKLRRFDIDIQVGLSDEIHPPKHQEKPELGIVSKHSLYQNQSHHFQFEDAKLDISQIIVAATQSLEGYQILRYLGVASEHQVVDSEVIMDEESIEVPRHYKELAQRLKAHALKANANAIVGLNYQLTPLPNEFGIGSNKYRLTCTGNIVWVNKL